MKVSRPKKVVSLAETQIEPTGWSGFLNKYGNSLATGVLIASAVFLFIRWRANSAERARMEVSELLQTAQSQVEILHSGRFAASAKPVDMLKSIQQTQTQATSAIERLIGNADADVQVRAQAYVLRGDMYWYLANLPPLPGSSSDPSLQLPESSDSLLTKAGESYQQVLRESAFADQHQQINAAHLGLAAIAENKSDWDKATKEFQAVIDDPNAVAVLAEAAKIELAMMARVKQQVYVAPPSGTPTTQAVSGLATPLGPMLPMPSTMPTIAVPAMTPTTKPAH
jgi:hypothetical protein